MSDRTRRAGHLVEVLDEEVARGEEGGYRDPSDHIDNTQTISADWQVGQ